MNERCGILFDLDGLLIDSLPIWRAAETRMFEAMGHRYDPEIVQQYLGMNAFDVAATAYRILQPPGPVEKYQAIMREALVAAYATGEIVEMPGAAGCVRRLHGLCPMAVASGSPEEGIAKAVDRLGVADCFDLIVTSETVARGKPAPDVFLRAAEMLGADPQRCVVFEDSLVGVEAGKAAGMTVVSVPSPSQDRGRIAALADAALGSLAEVTAERVRAYLKLS